MTSDDIIKALDLAPHPEGGWYRQTWIDETAEGRAQGTAIYFLLGREDHHHWHRVDAVEIWHHYAGAPIELRLAATEDGPAERFVLGPDITGGQRPQVIVPKDHWQIAQTTGDWTLVGCTVSPGFQFEGFEMATGEFDIPDA